MPGIMPYGMHDAVCSLHFDFLTSNDRALHQKFNFLHISIVHSLLSPFSHCLDRTGLPNGVKQHAAETHKAPAPLPQGITQPSTVLCGSLSGNAWIAASTQGLQPLF